MAQNFQQQSQEEAANKSVQKTAEVYQETAYKCPNCGMINSGEEKFCIGCGLGLKNNTCVHCGAATQPNYEICPACGKGLQAELCSFCGEEMDADSSFCPECGNPRSGIVCGQCHTLNFRSFCRQCNSPLNAQAQQALEEAKADPKFQKALIIAEELAELEEFLLSESEDDATPPEIPELSEENRQLINQYKDLLSAFRGQKPQDKPKEQPEAPKPEAKPQIKLSIGISTKEEAMEKYKEKLAEMQATLISMVPDAGMTPQMQRDYYSARKVEIVTKTKKQVPLYWLCNAYGCEHYTPNDCSKPFMGGKWFYKEVEEITSTWVNQ